jgi:CheY-like chemotaxis protein
MLTLISCGPYKLSVVLNACLLQYENSNANMTSTSPSSINNPPQPRKHRFSQFGPKLGLYPPTLAIRNKSTAAVEQVPGSIIQPQPPPLETVEVKLDEKVNLKIKNALIVDDNAINRRLLSAWMKRRKVPFKEAKDGQQALDMYKDADPKFDIILMDISMPVMDGMTSTRLIRDHEKEKELTPAHIIALTGLTSASARLEAWTSGVDDFLTKPVDFKKLECLIEVGRGGEGTGFIKEQANSAPERG